MLITIQFQVNIDLFSFQVASRKLPCFVSLILIRYYDFVLSSLALLGPLGTQKAHKISTLNWSYCAAIKSKYFDHRKGITDTFALLS
jgi:hypothetical protein